MVAVWHAARAQAESDEEADPWLLTRHRHGHQEVGRWRQMHVFAANQVELSWFFAAQAQTQESIRTQKTDRADNAVGGIALGIGIVELDDQIVRLVHGSGNELSHGGLLNSISVDECIIPRPSDTIGPGKTKFFGNPEIFSFLDIEILDWQPGRQIRVSETGFEGDGAVFETASLAVHRSHFMDSGR